MEKEYYDAQVKYINEIRSIRHDIQAHMIVLQYYLESENYEKAKAYLYDMRQHQNMEGIVIKDTGHDLVNAILSDTLSRSQRRIGFELDGMLPLDFCMTEYDVCTLFSNLFSNAKEACEKLVDTPPTISMEIRCENQECYIAIQNPVEWKVITDENGFVTSKTNKAGHGIGTKNIMKVVKKYNGKVDFLITDHTFRVEMVFKNQKNK